MKIIALVCKYLTRIFYINNKILTGIVSGILIMVFSSSNSLAAAYSFKDIQGHWARTDIEKAVDAGYIKGYTDSTFRPDQTVTRAEFVSMLNRIFDVPMSGIGSSFKDVKSSDWFAENVWAAVHAGYMDIYTGDTFMPNQPLTRQEAAALLSNLTQIDTEGIEITFKDNGQIADWAKKQVLALVSAGVINGCPDGNFKPDRGITRAEAVAVINRAKIYTDSVQINTKLTVTGSTVNIRSGPDTLYSITGKVYKGSMLTALLHSSNNWYKVTAGGLSGWIKGDYVRVSEIADRGGDVDRGEDAVRDSDADGGNSSGVTTGASVKLVVIDAGHGGNDNGASGLNGTKEKNINLAIASKLSNLLKDSGYNILMTRADDTFIPLIDRSIAANNAKADIFISIHCNASPDHNAGGTEVFTEPAASNPVYSRQEDSKRLAGLVQDSLVKALGLANRGIKEKDLSVCRETNAPAILIETAFIDNVNEEGLLNDPVFQDKVAIAVKQGVESYFTK